MDMVRLEKEEEKYDVDDVLGRDIKSVFPSLEKKEKDKLQMPMMPQDKVRELLGSSKFVTETELKEARKAAGKSEDDVGPSEPYRPLAQILQEQKDAKKRAAEERWTEMKRGKNRPLEEEDYEFFDKLAHEAYVKERQRQLEERQAMAQFQLRRMQAADEPADAKDKPEPPLRSAPAQPPTRAQRQPPAAKKKRPLVVIRKAGEERAEKKQARGSEGAEPAEREREEGGEVGAADTSGGLAGLLGDYGSDSD
ncbi:unnamed protein product [Pedinophyceae sp. YPF-701]|nr:unnamed protein product [Pedinophyceae sp. YPF-701]